LPLPLLDDYDESEVEGHETLFLLCFGNIERKIQYFINPEYAIFKPEIEES
jgi:hypothetical protein